MLEIAQCLLAARMRAVPAELCTESQLPTRQGVPWQLLCTALRGGFCLWPAHTLTWGSTMGMQAAVGLVHLAQHVPWPAALLQSTRLFGNLLRTFVAAHTKLCNWLAHDQRMPWPAGCLRGTSSCQPFLCLAHVLACRFIAGHQKLPD